MREPTIHKRKQLQYIFFSSPVKIDVITSAKDSASGSMHHVFVNHVLQTECRFYTFWKSACRAGDVLTRQVKGLEFGTDAQFQHDHVLSCAASDSKVTRLHMLSVVVTSITTHAVIATASGCYFTACERPAA